MTMEVLFEERHIKALSEERRNLPPDKVPERLEMRNLLLEIDNFIPPEPFPKTQILDFNLHRHWSSEHRTALWFPHQFNNFGVDEIYLRYGKSRNEIKYLVSKYDIPPVIDEPPDLGGFPAHAHIAIGLSAEGFFYQYVIGPRAWLDMNHMQDVILSSSPISDELFSSIRSLSAAGYEIWWGDEERMPDSFSSASEFGTFLTNFREINAEHWFVIRKQPYLVNKMLTVSIQDLITEIKHLFPVFNLASLR